MKRKNINNNKDDLNYDNSNTYFDYVQIGPLEEEILQEFHFDKDRFKEYLKSKEMDYIVNKDKQGK